MKKLVLVAVIFLVAGVTFGQTLKKGMVVAVSSYELILKDNVTFDQFIKFSREKYIPAMEKLLPGEKIYLLTGDRGENKFRYGELLVFDDVATRNKYYPIEDDTATSPALKAVLPQLMALTAETDNYVKYAKRVYTDWIVSETSGLELKPGTVLAVRAYELTLKDDVTSKQYKDFTEQKYNPAMEKAMPGTKMVTMWGDRGENKFRTGEMWVFDNLDIRNKYFPSENDTVNSQAMQTALDAVKPLTDEGNKYLVNAKRVYTDWIIK
jgi:hypothetical protein